jgi:hypothetical protein
MLWTGASVVPGAILPDERSPRRQGRVVLIRLFVAQAFKVPDSTIHVARGRRGPQRSGDGVVRVEATAASRLGGRTGRRRRSPLRVCRQPVSWPPLQARARRLDRRRSPSPPPRAKAARSWHPSDYDDMKRAGCPAARDSPARSTADRRNAKGGPRVRARCRVPGTTARDGPRLPSNSARAPQLPALVASFGSQLAAVNGGSRQSACRLQ